MERCWTLDPWDRPTFRDIEQDLHALTHSLDQSAAPTAVSLDTPISFPDCRRFKDDACVVAKVKATMKTMVTRPIASSPIFQDGAASLSFSVSSDEGEYLPVRDTCIDGHLDVSDEEGSCLPGSSFQYENTAAAPEPARY